MHLASKVNSFSFLFSSSHHNGQRIIGVAPECHWPASGNRNSLSSHNYRSFQGRNEIIIQLGQLNKNGHLETLFQYVVHRWNWMKSTDFGWYPLVGLMNLTLDFRCLRYSGGICKVKVRYKLSVKYAIIIDLQKKKTMDFFPITYLYVALWQMNWRQDTLCTLPKPCSIVYIVLQWGQPPCPYLPLM